MTFECSTQTIFFSLVAVTRFVRSETEGEDEKKINKTLNSNDVELSPVCVI